jgi:hypothetical protein
MGRILLNRVSFIDVWKLWLAVCGDADNKHDMEAESMGNRLNQK